MTRYRWVDSRRAEGFLVTLACAVAWVSTGGFYAWLTAMRHGPSPRDLDEAYLLNAIIDIHRDSDSVYGAPRIARQLCHDGWSVNRKRVERLMRENGIVGVHKRRGVRTTIPAEDNPPIPDLIGRGFDPGRPDVAWCGDITEIPTDEGKLYLLVTWNQTAWLRPPQQRYDKHDDGGAAVAGVGPARACGRVAAGVGRPRSCASHDRRVREGSGGVPALV